MKNKENFQLSTYNVNIISVAVVDDHTMVAEGLERLINASGQAVVIGKAFSVSGCMQLLSKSKPKVLLLDVSLPDGNGIDLALKIKALYPDLKVLILTSHSEITFIRQAFFNGVSGFIMKNAAADVIMEGIRTVASGKRFLCAETSRIFKRKDNQSILLSRREQELLRLIVAGKSNTEIADSMCLGFETVKSYRKRLMLKMNTAKMAELVRMAVEKQLV